MRIRGNEGEKILLKEIGERIKQYRISANITQSELAEKCGISSSTEVRIENGEDSKFSNYLKILSALNLSENLDVLVPEPQPDYKEIYEKMKIRKRASHKKRPKKSNWVWGEDK